jgi:hypothetical protein
MGAGHLRQHPLNLGLTHHNRWPPVTFGPHMLDKLINRLVENSLV